jgi:RimJ/RimL family protein N-acetyltransferase
MQLRTPRLTVRAWDPDDEAEVAAAYDIYRRDEVARWLGATPEPWPSREATRSRLERWATIPENRPGYGLWAVVPDEVGHPVGTVLLVPLPDADNNLTDDVEIGWHFHPDHWGHGYATEASAALLEHAFVDLGLPRVEAVAYAGNQASFAVMRRLGMTHQGSTDRWYGTTFEWWSITAPDAASPGT